MTHEECHIMSVRFPVITSNWDLFYSPEIFAGLPFSDGNTPSLRALKSGVLFPETSRSSCRVRDISILFCFFAGVTLLGTH